MMKIKNLKLKIVEKFKIFAPISLAIILIGAILMIAIGLNVGIDFGGGATVSIDLGATITNKQELKDDVVDELTKFIEGEGFEIGSTRWSGDDEVIEFGLKYTLNGEKVDASSEEAQKAFLDKINGEDGLKHKLVDAVIAIDSEFDITAENISETIVSGSTSRKLLSNAIWATAIAVVVMLIYIGFRFTLASGIAAVIALTHDVLIMIALTTIFRVQVNTTFIAAIITIVGYSINATIVIFDRIREVKALDSMKEESNAAIANKAIVDTLGRSILTTLTTLAVIVVLAIVCAVTGLSTMSEFALPIVFGLIAGAYSSVLLSAPIWVHLCKIGDKIKAKK